MSSVHIRDVSPATLARLKRLAGQHERSLQGELRSILNQAAMMVADEGGGSDWSLHVVRSGNSQPPGRDEIYGEQGR